MNIKIKNMVKNVSYSFFANIVSIFVSVVSIIFLPKFMNVEDYGVWQLYLFYTSYLGFFHFGWIDGIYLRYGGYDFDKLDKLKFTGQFVSLLLTEIAISLIGLGCIYFFINDYFTKEVLIFTCYLLVPVILATFASFILQITNKIKEYAQLTVLGRILFFITLIIYFSLGSNSYVELIYLDITSKVITLLYGVYLIRDLLKFKLDKYSSILLETYKNLSVGSKLLLANIAGMLILGIVRFGISQVWDVATFGKVSLTLNCSNFLMVFINAMSVVFFPMLKRTDVNKFRDIYINMCSLLTISLLGFLLIYYPVNCILSWWLPKYQDSLIYMVMLLPICLFESKVALLTNTYLKSLRKEKLMLKINAGVVLLSLVLTYISAFLLKNLDLAVLIILILFAVKSICSEFVLGKLLSINLKKDILQEVLMVALFVSINYFLDSMLFSLAIYLVAYLVYLLVNKNLLINAVRFLR